MRLAVVALVLVCGARTAAAYDCYEVKQGAALYAEVMAERVVGTTTAELVGWFGRTQPDDPTIALTLVGTRAEGDDQILVAELRAYVEKDDATAVACPARWRRGLDEKKHRYVTLTWPGAEHAGAALRTAIATPRRKARKRHGRACFASSVPGVSATVCAAIKDDARPACVSIAAGKPVFARASTEARLGETTEKVIAEVRARVDGLLAVSVRSGGESFWTYVRRKDTRRAKCPPPDYTATLSAEPTTEALLPDGTDAGFRYDALGSIGDAGEAVVVGGRTLRCYDHSPVTGLALRVCVAD